MTVKWMDTIVTTAGPGVAVAQMAVGGGVLVCIRRADVRGRNCGGPCLNVEARWCAVHEVWCVEEVCEMCSRASARKAAGDEIGR